MSRQTVLIQFILEQDFRPIYVCVYCVNYKSMSGIIDPQVYYDVTNNCISPKSLTSQ